MIPAAVFYGIPVCRGLLRPVQLHRLLVASRTLSESGAFSKLITSAFRFLGPLSYQTLTL